MKTPRAAKVKVFSSAPLDVDEAQALWIDLFTLACAFGVDERGQFGREVYPFVQRALAALDPIRQPEEAEETPPTVIGLLFP